MKRKHFYKLHFTILMCSSFFFVEAQPTMMKYYYIKKDGQDVVAKKEAFHILKQYDSYTFILEPEKKKILYKSGNSNFYEDSMRYGPYKFKKNFDTIQFALKLNDNWSYQDLYLLKPNQVFLVPDLFSTSIDSYNISCILIDSSYKIKIDTVYHSFYKFLERRDNLKSYRVVYLNKKEFLPFRIEYYSDKNFQVLSTIIECKELF